MFYIRLVIGLESRWLEHFVVVAEAVRSWPENRTRARVWAVRTRRPRLSLEVTRRSTLTKSAYCQQVGFDITSLGKSMQENETCEMPYCMHYEFSEDSYKKLLCIRQRHKPTSNSPVCGRHETTTRLSRPRSYLPSGLWETGHAVLGLDVSRVVRVISGYITPPVLTSDVQLDISLRSIIQPKQRLLSNIGVRPY